MAWSAPITAVANTAFTANDFNKNIRDNMLAMAPALANAPGSYFAVAATGLIAQRTPAGQAIATSESVTNTAWGDLPTVGPSVTVTTGTAALAFYTASCAQNTVNMQAGVNILVSGASNVSPYDTPAYWVGGKPVNEPEQGMGMFLYTGLRPGINVFTMKYRAWTSGTATFANRQLLVLPL